MKEKLRAEAKKQGKPTDFTLTTSGRFHADDAP
jgi:hypothetical protein